MKLTTGLVTISGVRHNPQLYDEFLDDVVDTYTARLKKVAEGEDPETVEKIEKELSTPTGDLRFYFSTLIDGLIGPFKDDDRGLLWVDDMAYNEVDRFMETVRG